MLKACDWLLVVMSLLSIAQEVMSHCCRHTGSTADCSNCNLTSIPVSEIDPTTTHLLLNDNILSNIPNDIFINFTRLIHLNLMNNPRLQEFHKNSFRAFCDQAIPVEYIADDSDECHYWLCVHGIQYGAFPCRNNTRVPENAIGIRLHEVCSIDKEPYQRTNDLFGSNGLNTTVISCPRTSQKPTRQEIETLIQLPARPSRTRITGGRVETLSADVFQSLLGMTNHQHRPVITKTRVIKPAEQCVALPLQMQERYHEDGVVVAEGFHVFGGTFRPSIDNETACFDSCKGKCQAADFDRIGLWCFHHFSDSACKPLHPKKDVIHFKFHSCVPQGFKYMVCAAHIRGGTLVAGGVTGEQCRRLCLADPECLALDYDNADHTCWVHNSATYAASMKAKKDVVHYKRVPLFKDVMNNFLEVWEGFHVLGGEELCTCTKFTCLKLCAKDKECMGVDFNNVTKKCFKHSSKSECNGLNSKESCTHYRRQACQNEKLFKRRNNYGRSAKYPYVFPGPSARTSAKRPLEGGTLIALGDSATYRKFASLNDQNKWPVDPEETEATVEINEPINSARKGIDDDKPIDRDPRNVQQPQENHSQERKFVTQTTKLPEVYRPTRNYQNTQQYIFITTTESTVSSESLEQDMVQQLT